MAQDRTANLEQELLQGARGVQNSTENMLERLAKEFTATDLVTIKNILPDPFGWVYTDPRETTITQPDTATKRVDFGDPKARTLEPGETKTIPGWEAYIALERMWKTYAQRDISQVGYILASVQEMDKFLAEAYQGTFDPDSVGGAKPDLGFDKTPAQVNQDRTASAENAVASPAPAAPVVPPTQDPALGFSDDEVQTPPQTQVPPINDPDQTPAAPQPGQNQTPVV